MPTQCNGLTTRRDALDAETIERLRALPLFAALDRAGLVTLLEGAIVYTAGRNESLFQQGQLADRFYIVLGGRVALLLIDETGRESIIDVVKPGDTFGEEAVFDRGVFSFAARAIDPVRLVRVPAEMFLQVLASDFRFLSLIMASMSAHLHCLVKQVGELKLKSTEQRLASYLAGLMPEASGMARITLPYEKKVVASQLGMQPETLSRAFAKLRKLGIRACRGVFVVDDIGRLRAFCHGGDLSSNKGQPSVTPCSGDINHERNGQWRSIAC